MADYPLGYVPAPYKPPSNYVPAPYKPPSNYVDPNTYGPSGGMVRRAEGNTAQAMQPAPVGGQQNPLSNQYNLLNTSVATQAKDYGNIMDQFGNLVGSSANKPLTPATYSPSTYTYAPSPQVMSSLNNLQSLTQTGGYAPGDAQNIRSRALSPIRSIYSSAQQNVDRNAALRGNTSGYGAVKSRMARDLAQQISDASINAEASIAGDVARNKISIAPQYASAAGAESGLSNQYGSRAVDVNNDAQKFNIQTPLDYAKVNQAGTGQQSDILRAMTSLYGTTPALASLYGGQALDAAQLQNLINQQNKQAGSSFTGSILGALR